MKTFFNLLLILLFVFTTNTNVAQTPKLEQNINKNQSQLSSKPLNYVELNNTLYFFAEIGYSEQTLWAYNGTSDPEIVLPEEQPPISNKSFLTKFNNKLYFNAYDSIHGYELWYYSPESGFQMADDITNGKESSTLSSAFTLNNKLFFFKIMHENYRVRYDLLEYDESIPAHTPENVDSSFYSVQGTPLSSAGKVFFMAEAGNYMMGNMALYEFDGSNNPEKIDLDDDDTPHSLITSNDKLYIEVAPSTGWDNTLWQYDGENPPEKINTPKGSIIPFAFAFDKLFYSFNGDIFMYDGSPVTNVLNDIFFNYNISNAPEAYHYNGNALYFFGSDPEHNVSIWKYENGTSAEEIVKVPNYNYMTNELIIFNNQLIYRANNGHGIEMQVFDLGSNSKKEYDLRKGDNSSNLNNPFIFNNELYFSAFDTLIDYQLWKYNGAGFPVKIKHSEDINWSNLLDKIVFNDKLIFSGKIDNYGFELLEYDGINPPSMVADIYEGGLWGYPEHFTEFNSNIYFSAENDTAGVELWRYDGNKETQIVADIYNGNKSSSPENLIVFNDKLYFSAEDSTYGKELWSMDHDENVQLVFDCRKGEYSSTPKLATVFNNKLYFSAYVEIIGTSLWEYNGEDDPINLKATDENWEDIVPHEMVVFNNKLILSAYTDSTGIELWSYDGENPPQQIADLNPGEVSSGPSNFKVINQTLYFSAHDGEHGTELWSYNGNDAPQMMADIFVGRGNSNPEGFTLLDDKVYFAATNGTEGRELWSFVPNLDTYFEKTVIACGDYLSPKGNVYDQSGTYTDTLMNNAGADSIITTHLTIENINIEINIVNDTLLQSLQNEAEYQWINCKTDEPIEGATEQEFIATKNGDYAVIVFTEHCTDTSECVNVIRTSVDEQRLSEIIVSPNPSQGQFKIHFGQVEETAEIRIFNTNGSVVEHKKVKNSSFANINIEAKPGIYYVEIITGKNTLIRKTILE